MDVPLSFGAELRRLRQEAGMTLEQLAKAVNYSTGHLSKVERGGKRPPLLLARLCDDRFETGGLLGRIVMSQATADGPKFAVGRRGLISTGMGSLVGLGLAGGGNGDRREDTDTSTPAVFRDQLHVMRLLGQSAAPSTLLPLLRAQTSTVVASAARTSGAVRGDLLIIASRFAEYTGWMAQEAGDEAAALRWTAEAVELAEAGGDTHLAVYALVRQALVTFYGGAAQETVALAQQAQRRGLPHRIRGLAAQREAQGHALAGDAKACMRGLDRARVLLAEAEPPDGAPVLGPTHLADPAAMVRGWCLYDLGRVREAAEILDDECRRIDPAALRSRTRYGFRRALAHAASGEVEHAAELAGELLAFTDIVPSATVRADVRRLDHELSRYRTHRSVRLLQPALMRALSTR